MAHDTTTPTQGTPTQGTREFELKLEAAGRALLHCMKEAGVEGLELHYVCRCGCGTHHVVRCSRATTEAPSREVLQ